MARDGWYHVSKSVVLGTPKDALGSEENVTQNFLFLPRIQQTSHVLRMEVLVHVDVPVSQGHAYSHGGSGRGLARERADRETEETGQLQTIQNDAPVRGSQKVLL